MNLQEKMILRFMLGTYAEGYTPEDEFIYEFYKDENNYDATRILFYIGKRNVVKIPPSFHNGDVLIPTKKIEATAFNYCDFLTKVTIPDGVVEIG